jgi:uncharacterized phiE125 gp8 family phage protein
MKNLQVRVYTDLTTEPVTVAEAKNYCKITGTQDDALMAILITAARKSLEKYTQSSFAHKHLHATWVTIPENWEVELPYGPIISVDKVYKIDEEGTEEELTVNVDYYIYGDQDFVLKVEQFWSTGLTVSRSLRVEYTAGYGDTVTETLPDELKLAILKQVATDYMLRENILPGTSATILDNAAKRMAAPYKKKIWF